MKKNVLNKNPLNKTLASALTVAVAAFAFPAMMSADYNDGYDNNQAEYSQQYGEEKKSKRGKKGKRGGKKLMKALDKVGASDAQKTEIKAILDAYKPNLQAAESRDERKAIKEQMQAEINQVLTPEQVAELESMKQERKGKRGKRDRG